MLLRPYSTDTIAEHIQQDPPPPVIKVGVEEYEVEHILDSQVFRNKLEYLVHWKGYCEGYTTPYNKSPFPGVLLVMMATTTT